MNLRRAWKTICALAWVLAPMASAGSPVRQPNFIIIFMDDVGYADVGCFGAKTFKTPRIDSLATDGMRLTSFYAQAVCGPSRGALMTGRYPVRVGGGWNTFFGRWGPGVAGVRGGPW